MESRTRPLNEPERRYLQWHASRLQGGALKEIAIGSCFGSGCVSLPLGGIAVAASHTLHGSVAARIIAGAAIVATLWLIFFVAGLIYRRKEAAKTADERRRIENDLKAGVAAVHRFRARDVFLAYGNRRRERNYFVHLDDERVLFLGVWKPPTCTLADVTGTPDERGFPSSEFEVATGPESRLILEVLGRGEFLRPVDEFDLANRKLKLASGEIVPTPWEDVRKTYG